MIKGGRPRTNEGTVYERVNSANWWVRYRNAAGRIVKESTGTADRQEAERFLRDRLNARDDGQLTGILTSKTLTFDQWADWFLERRSKPPYRAEKTHAANQEVVKNLRPVFGEMQLREITPEAIEAYLDQRLRSHKKIRTKFGVRKGTRLKPATVHRDFRVLHRILNVAVKQRKLPGNPCDVVEFPTRLRGTTRKPHYMTSSEQVRIEFAASPYLRNAIVIMVEMGLRPYRELMPMRKQQLDMENRVVHVPDSKTPSGIADMPMTQQAKKAFESQMELAGDSEYLFPATRGNATRPYLTNLSKGWGATLRRAGVPHFSIYELRHTFATRLSAGGVADHFVTQMLRQGDAAVFKRYSQAKLNMMREALERLDRQANEHGAGFGTVVLEQ